MINWRPYIGTDPEVLSGKPVVKGTRLAVDFILGLFASGWTEERVLENYPALSQESLRAVFAFAAEILGDEAVYPTRRKMGQLRFLADENVPNASIQALREAGHDVVAVADVSPGATDRDVLQFACSETRFLLTFDRDFGALAFGPPLQLPPDIVFLRFEPLRPDEPATIMLEVLDRDEIALEGHLAVINRTTVRQRSFS